MNDEAADEEADAETATVSSLIPPSAVVAQRLQAFEGRGNITVEQKQVVGTTIKGLCDVR